ncbi:hypothetical protein L915_05188, partial [Phytophthora nicotianae]
MCTAPGQGHAALGWDGRNARGFARNYARQTQWKERPIAHKPACRSIHREKNKEATLLS